MHISSRFSTSTNSIVLNTFLDKCIPKQVRRVKALLSIGLLILTVMACQQSPVPKDNTKEPVVGTQAAPIGAFGYARVSASGYAAPVLSYSPGGNVSARRFAEGHYEVTFPGLGGADGGHVQISSVGANLAMCKVRSWTSFGDDFRVRVDCRSPLGSFTNATFNALVTWPPERSRMSYAWIRASNSSYTLSGSYSYSSYGVDPSVRHNGTGSYTVKFFNFGGKSMHENVQVTSYGFSDSHCMVNPWSKDDTYLNVNVSCFDSRGNPVNSQFNVLVTWPDSFESKHAFAWSASERGTNTYSSNSRYAHNSEEGRITVRHRGSGLYNLEIEGLHAVGNLAGAMGHLQVTAYDYRGNARHCQLNGHAAREGKLIAGVQCFNPTGLSRTQATRFTVLALTPRASFDAVKQVQVQVQRLQATSSDSCGEMDFFVNFQSAWNETTSVIQGNDIRPPADWNEGVRLSGDRLDSYEDRLLRVYVLIYDADSGIFCGGSDDKVDVHPDPGQAWLRLDVDLSTFEIFSVVQNWPGEDDDVTTFVGYVGDTIRSEGFHGQETGIITYQVNVTDIE